MWLSDVCGRGVCVCRGAGGLHSNWSRGNLLYLTGAILLLRQNSNAHNQSGHVTQLVCKWGAWTSINYVRSLRSGTAARQARPICWPALPPAQTRMRHDGGGAGGPVRGWWIVRNSWIVFNLVRNDKKCFPNLTLADAILPRSAVVVQLLIGCYLSCHWAHCFRAPSMQPHSLASWWPVQT